MLVQNDLDSDTRVRKEAESLASNGFDVHVIGHAAEHLASNDLIRGVIYHRLAVRSGLASIGVRTPGARMRGIGTRTPSSARSSRQPARGTKAARSSLLHFAGRARNRVVETMSTVSRHTGWALTTKPLLDALRPDVIHAHDLDSLLAALRHVRRHSNTQFVYDAHELELHRNIAWTRWKRTVASMIERHAIHRADAVVTVSPLIARDLAATYRITTPAVLLNSPRLASRTLEPALDLRCAASLGDADRLVVYVGGMLWRRGHEQLVRALSHLPANFHVGVLGARNAAREAPMLELAQRLGVTQRLHLFSSVPADQVPATLRVGADATVIPIPNVCRSYDYALPNKLFDSVMAGVPIGVSRLTHLSEFVRVHGVGLVFDETDPRSIATTLDRLVTQASEFRPNADRLTALQECVAWDAQERVLLDVYDRLAASTDAHAVSHPSSMTRS